MRSGTAVARGSSRCIRRKSGDFGIEHLGIQAETPAELEELRGRLDRAGGTVTDEGETTCCYANSDKTWVVDQQGVSWEAFYTSDEADAYYAEEETACCEPA